MTVLGDGSYRALRQRDRLSCAGWSQGMLLEILANSLGVGGLRQGRHVSDFKELQSPSWSTEFEGQCLAKVGHAQYRTWEAFISTKLSENVSVARLPRLYVSPLLKRFTPACFARFVKLT